jgi:hypothetical protein
MRDCNFTDINGVRMATWPTARQQLVILGILSTDLSNWYYNRKHFCTNTHNAIEI